MPVFDVEGQLLSADRTDSAPLPEGSDSIGKERHAQQWRPKRAVLIGAGIGVFIIAALTFGLVFGLESGDGGSPGVATLDGLPIGCRELLQSNFWEVLAPKEYNISLTLGLELFVSGSERADQFSAAAALSFDVVQPTNCIVLHSRDLVFEDITLTTGDGEVIRICSGGDECKSTVIETVLANPPANSFDADLIVLDLQNTTLEPGSVPVISFAYKGTVGVDPRALGIHRSLPYAVCTSKGTDCEERYLVSSQLEPTGARRVFPSYDGPAHKAIFNIQLTAPAAEAPIVLSNAPEASTSFSEDGSKTTTTFEPTPKMSPYLVAITAGILEEAPVVSTSTGRRRLAQQTPQKVLRAWGVPGRSVLMADALELATAALQYFEEYFGVPQPVSKFDFVAVPGRTGAMENWGLLLFDEERVLYGPETSGAYGRVLLASVICHEVAHQWLGNLVTAPNWEQLTMNEGLASAEEYGCMEAVAPDVSSMTMRYRVVPPASERLSAHNGVFTTAIELASDPLLPALILESDFSLEDSPTSRLMYAKGGAMFFLLGTYVNLAMTPLRPEMWRYAMGNALRSRQYTTLSYFNLLSEIYTSVLEVSQEKVGPGKQFEVYPWSELLLDRLRDFLVADEDPVLERQLGSNGTAILASWGYSPGMPFFPAVPHDILVPDDAAQTVLNIGMTQKRFCAWRVDAAEAKELGIKKDDVDRIAAACETPVRFSTILHMDNLTDCPATEGTQQLATTAGPLERGNLTQNSWVLNTNGERAWRSGYTEEHFSYLVELMKDMRSCPATVNTTAVDGGDGLCCAVAGDALEAAAIVSDAVALAFSGEYPGDWALKAAEAVTSAEVASTGYGHYIMVLSAVEAVETLQPIVAANATCSTQLESLKGDILRPHAAIIFQRATENEDISGVPKGAEAQVELLRKLAISPLLTRAALVQEIGLSSAPSPPPFSPSNESADTATASTTDTGKRKLLQEEEDLAPGEAPPQGDEDVVAEAPSFFADEEAPSPSQGPVIAGPDASSAIPAPTPVDIQAPTPLAMSVAAPAPAPIAQAVAQPTVALAPVSAPADSLQTRLCTLLLSTPLWRNFVADDETGQDTSTQAPSADLLPAVYAVAAAMPTDCRHSIDSIYSSTAFSKSDAARADPKVGIRTALVRCWLYEPIYAEASRCLHADPETASRDLSLLASNAPAASDSLELQLRYKERMHYLQGRHSWLLAQASLKRPDAWIGVLDSLQDDALWNELGPRQACETINLMRAAATDEERSALRAFFNGKGSECSSEVRTRALGRMASLEKVSENILASICSYLVARER